MEPSILQLSPQPDILILVEPDILIKKLEIYGFESDFIQWIKSYFQERYQSVWMNHVFSEFIHCEIGVPQGSILGPLLFLVYFNDLPSALDGNTDSYADDTTLSYSGTTIEQISSKLCHICESVSTWMKSNRFKLNPQKTHVLTMATQKRLVSLPNALKVKMDKIELVEDSEKCELLLGCKIQANLKWNSQISFVIGKLRTRLVALMQVKNILPLKILKTVAEGIFNSILVYCLPLYGGCEINLLKEIQVMQNKAAQIVCRVPPRSNRAAMYDRLDWLTVSQLTYYHSLLLVFRIKSTKEPEYLYRILSNENRLGKIIVSNTGLTLAKRSFTFRAAEDWNRLPLWIRQLKTIGSFKKTLRKWVVDNIPRFSD